MFDRQQFALLALLAEFLTDLERLRIANDNRARALRDDLGIAEGPEVAAVEQLSELFHQAELIAVNDLRHALRALPEPIVEWVQSTIGVGEKTAARLLGVIGHPRWRFDAATEEWHPRTIAQLWAYCGYHVDNGEAPRHKNGQQSNWNHQARMRTFLIAEACMKQRRSPFRVVYDDGREKYAEAVHEHDCVRCGPHGNPAKAGSPLSDGHKHARALRLVAKAIIKDLWVAAE